MNKRTWKSSKHKNCCQRFSSGADIISLSLVRIIGDLRDTEVQDAEFEEAVVKSNPVHRYLFCAAISLLFNI